MIDRRQSDCLLLLDRIHERAQWLAFMTDLLFGQDETPRD